MTPLLRLPPPSPPPQPPGDESLREREGESGNGGAKGGALPCPPPPPAPAPPPGPAPLHPHPPGRDYIAGQAAVPPRQSAPPGGMGGSGWLRRAAGGVGRVPRSAPRSGAGHRTFAARQASDGEQEEPMEKPDRREEIKLLARSSRADSQTQIHPQPPPATKSRDGRQARRWLHNRAGSRSTTSSLDCWHLDHPNNPRIK